MCSDALIERSPAIGVYVHFPWCLRKCPYCDFFSSPIQRSDVPHRDYTDGVLAELERRCGDLSPGVRLETLYFGGGTPSLWEPGQIGRVVSGVARRLGQGSGSRAVEVTVEANPSSFSRELGCALVDEGVNRLSLGLQGLNDERLRFLGRLHSAEEGLRALRDALQSGAAQVSADLIFGLPGQDAASAAHEVRIIAETGVNHISAYALTVEPGTPFGALARQGRLPLVQEDEAAEAYLAVEEALIEQGFEHYEISSFSRPGCASQHNLGYWRGRDYLGLGCAAWGTVRVYGQRLRYRNTQSPERYLALGGDWANLDPWCLSRGEPGTAREGGALGVTEAGDTSPLSEREVIDAETELCERLMLGLRTSYGVDTDRVSQELGLPLLTPRRARKVERLVARGQLVQHGPVLSIPRSAWLMADGIIAELM